MKPLSDVFSSNALTHMRQSPTRQENFNQKTAKFAIAKDAMPPSEPSPKPKAASPSKHYTDSGYHGMTEDEMEIDVPVSQQPQGAYEAAGQEKTNSIEILDVQAEPNKDADIASEERRTTEGSFHSAREEVTRRMSQPEAIAKNENRNEEEIVPEDPKSPKIQSTTKIADHNLENEENQEPSAKAIYDEHDLSDLGSPSDGSTPDKLIVRKSSLTFASLPAREPIPTKKSFGTRVSHTSQVDHQRARSSHFTGLTGPPRITQILPEPSNKVDKTINTDAIMRDVEDVVQSNQNEESDPDEKIRKMHNKSSTQRLHERIGMLGKSQPSRPSKSIAQNATATTNQVKYPQLMTEKQPVPLAPAAPRPHTSTTVVDDDDDWIKPLNGTEKSSRLQMVKSHTTDVVEGTDLDSGKELETQPQRDLLNYKLPVPPGSPSHESVRRSPSPSRFGHTKSASTISPVSPTKASMQPSHKQNISVSNPPHGATTPTGSPRRLLDGPLSASKSKFQSIMKTAKGLFTSGASISASAKMETLSPQTLRAAEETMPGAFLASTDRIESKPLPPSPQKEIRRTRSSTEREREERRKEKDRERDLKERQRTQDQLEKVREKERQKAAEYKQTQLKSSASVASLPRQAQPVRRSPRRPAEDDDAMEKATSIHNLQSSAVPGSQASSVRPNEARRPVKSVLQANTKAKEPPRAIRIGMPSQRMGPPTSTFSSLQESLPPAATKPKTVMKQASNTSLHTTASNSSLKASASSQAGKLKSLTAAAKKKELVGALSVTSSERILTKLGRARGKA